ncbi:hypothetical protein [Kitasatospora sp. NPDC005748]|uniref:hypothetical protein n=1 Tax=Kitasatospora sp. NPDC005748 TaxID=3157063 RepID=UPI0033FEC451
MTLQEAEAAGLLGLVGRAREVHAEADALMRGTGPFLSAPEAAAIWGRMTQTIDSLLWRLTGEGAA